uniref:Uncharacterized protein n=1 Tax=Tanacetum cinerariifolium TaxID=118510 RepID=A0A6L2M5H6_TANCI|nr:hypothetical protein [Tanacetum cinerariifolium]
MDSQVNVSKREETTGRVNHDNLRALLQQSQEDAAKGGKNNFDSSRLLSGSVNFDGEKLMRSMTIRRNKMTGKRDVNANASQSTPSTQHDIISELIGMFLKTYKDFEDFINNIELGKCEVWLELYEEKRQEVFNNLCVMFKAFKVENPNDSIPSKASPSDPILQPVDINTNSTSYAGVAGASTKESPRKWSMDTRLLKEEVNRISIWVKLHDVPIQVFEKDGISLIATFIGKPVMLGLYTSSMYKDSWGMSSFARYLIEVNSEADLMDVVTIGVLSFTRDDFTKETIRVEVVSPPIVTTSNVVTPIIVKTNDGFQTVGKKKKRKGKSKSTNGGQFSGPSVKPTVRYEPKAIPSALKKGTPYVGYASKLTIMSKTTGTFSKNNNIIMSNSYSAFNEEEDEDEDVENVYDETANLFLITKTNGSLSFTTAAG